MLNDVQCGHLIKILWHDGIGMSLYAKRLERGRFLWPSPADGIVAISAAQLAYMLDGIDWRKESAARFCDSLDAWIRILTSCPQTSTR